jgi:phosphoserine/homoserine phosphotransferase
MTDHVPPLLATDLEGILLPEIWIAVAERTGIAQLRQTTRDVADYDALMRMRLGVLRDHNLKLADLQAVIAGMEPLPGALEFLGWARAQAPLVIITDSYYELLAPFLPKLDFATIFANHLETDDTGNLTGYRLRVVDGKRKALHAFGELGFRTMAVGDSYNDIGMLEAADHGVLFRPPTNVVADFPAYPVTWGYAELQAQVRDFVAGRVHQQS